MDAIANLHSRVSHSKVVGPAPSEQARDSIFRAALRAPDHAQLRPWRFLRIEGESLQGPADLLETAALTDKSQLSQGDRASPRANARREPLASGVISRARP